MPETLQQIAARVNTTVNANNASGGSWGQAFIDFQAPVWNANPAGDRDELGLFGELAVLGRYGNWTGGGYGGGHLSPAFDFGKYDLSKASDRAAYAANMAEFTQGGQYWENPAIGYLDEFDRLARSHDLLYQDANLKAAADYQKAGQDFAAGLITKAQLDQKLQAAKDEQERSFREADVWFLHYSGDAEPSHALGYGLKKLSTSVFGLYADAYYAANPRDLSTREVLDGVGQKFGARLGSLLGEDKIFADIGGIIGFALGDQITDLFTGDDTSILTSLLAATKSVQGTPDQPLIMHIVADKLSDAGLDVGALTVAQISKFYNTLIADAADALGLSGLGEYAFVQTGEAIGKYLERILTSGEIDSFADFFETIGGALNFEDIGTFLLDVTIDFLANEFTGFLKDIIEDAKGLVDIDSPTEAIMAEISSMIGAVIGAIELPFLGGEIGSTIGYILGSIQYEILNTLTFGLLDEIGDFFFDTPEPDSWIYVGLDADNHLEVAAYDWKKDGVGEGDIRKIHDGNMKLVEAYMEYVNGVIDGIGGRVSAPFFVPIPTSSGGLPDGVYLSHANIHYYKDHFYVTTYWGGDTGSRNSNDPSTLVENAAAYELAHLVFTGGDLSQIRALNRWEADLNTQLPAAQQAEYALTQNLASRPGDPRLELLSANLNVAQEYRLYLDNAEAINALMLSAPGSAFTLGWLATLARAAELGLNQAYSGWQDGAAGSELADTILSADGNDLLYGNGGDDLLKSYGGDDTVYGGEGNDIAFGGGGSDLLLGDQGNDTLHGGEGIDRLFGYTGNDTLYGDGGNDQLAGEAGDDTVFGGAGDDVLYGDIPGVDGRDDLHGDAGDDLIRGGGGDDLVAGDAGDDQLYGDAGDDAVSGGDGADRIWGGGGADLLAGGAEADSIQGEDGDDRIDGDAGNDSLYGGRGDDVVRGGSDEDQLFGDAGSDLLQGDAGNDTLAGWSGGDRLEGGEGHDLLLGEDGDDLLLGGGGNDTLYGDRQPSELVPAHSEAEIIARTESRIGAGDFAILYGGDNYSVAGLLAAGHDMAIVNLASSASTDAPRSEELWAADQVAAVQAGGTRLIGYLDLAKINDFTLMWQTGWTADGTSHGVLTGDAPSFLGAGDTVFGHARLVDFGDPEWQSLLFARVDVLVEKGFSGIFLDDPVEYFARGTNDAERAEYAREMRDLVIAVVEHARSAVAASRGAAAVADFQVIINGAPFLIQDTTADGSAHDAAKEAAFYASIDAILAENYISQGLQYAIDQTVREYGARGIAMLSVDTGQITEFQRIEAERRAIDAGFLPEAVPDAVYFIDTPRFEIGFGDVRAPGNDVLLGGDGYDILIGGAGDDRLDGGAGDDTIDGGDGIDAADYSLAGAAVRIDLSLAEDQDTVGAGVDTLVSIEAVLGSAYGDGLAGGGNADWLQGAGGADAVAGGEGHDSLWGGDGDDDLEGGAGDDTLWGGAGTDTASYAAAGAGVEIDLSLLEEQDTRGAGTDTLIAVENLTGSAFADRLAGTDGANVLRGGAGDDVIVGRGGNDVLFGGEGADTFVFGPGGGSGTIADFLAGTDKIDLSAFGFTSFAQIQAEMTFQEGATHIALGEGGSATLTGVTIAQLGAGDFVLADPLHLG